jgi:hypothetical protein
MPSSLTPAALWGALVPPRPSPAVAVNAATRDSAALQTALRWHEMLSHAPAAVLSAAGRVAAYDGVPPEWADTFALLLGPSGTDLRTGFELPSQFPVIAQAPDDLTTALDWNLGEVAWLLWTARNDVAALLPPMSPEALAEAAYLRAMINARATSEILDSLTRLLDLAESSFAVWGSAGFLYLAFGGETSESAERASRAFVRAADNLPTNLRLEADAFLSGYAAIADVLAGRTSHAVDRLQDRLAQGDDSPSLLYQALRWSAVSGAGADMLEPLDDLVSRYPVYLLRFACDPVVLASPEASSVLQQVVARQRTVTEALLADLARQQHDRQGGARFPLHLPASAMAAGLPVARLTSAMEWAVARQRLGQRLGDQAAALRMWPDAEAAASAVFERLAALPTDIAFRIPEELGRFGATVNGSGESDWRLIQRLGEQGEFAELLRYVRALEDVLPGAYARALADNATVLKYALHSIAQYGQDIQGGRGPWTAKLLHDLRDARDAAAQVERSMTDLGSATDDSAANKMRASWSILQQITTLWRNTTRLVAAPQVILPRSQVTIASGDWLAVVAVIADKEGYAVGGMPVFWRSDDVVVEPRWPHSAWVPNYSVSLASGRTFLPIEAKGRAARDCRVEIGLAQDSFPAVVHVTVEAAPSGAVMLRDAVNHYGHIG